MRHFTRTLTFALTTAVLSACATYSEPTSGPVAFVTLVGSGVGFAIGHESYCQTKAILPASDKKPVKVSAGNRIWIQVNTTGSAYSRCRGEVSFVPEPGAHYVGKYEQCTFSFARAMPHGQISGVPSAISEPERNCLTDAR